MRKPLLAMFNMVPKHYDLVNRMLTLGFDERWRRRTAKLCLDAKPAQVMDICCGTGDMALHLAKMAPDGVEITGVDYCEPMLEVARVKAKSRGLEHKVSFHIGEVANLPYAAGHFDVVTVSFGFRNLTYRNPMRYKYLTEILRVIRRGGQVMILETCQPHLAPIRMLYHFYLTKLSSRIGALLSGQRGPYRYLGQSAANYFKATEICRLLTDAGFGQVDFTPLLWQVAAIYIATR